MRPTWQTKYGPRRVKHDPPTLQEAITAAKCITDDVDGQAEIAASLMGLAVDEVKAEVAKANRTTARAPQVSSIFTATQRAVVVERRPSRRIAAPARRLGS